MEGLAIVKDLQLAWAPLGSYLLSGLLGAVVTWAILPRPGGRRAGWLRLGQWLVATSFAMTGIAIVWSVSSLVQIIASIAPRGDVDVARDMAFLGTQVVLTLATAVLAYTLAALLYRRLNWPVVEARTGWHLGGPRRWLVYLLAAAFFAWPGQVVTWLVQAAQAAAWSGATSEQPVPAWSGAVQWLVVMALSLGVAAWTVWHLPADGDGAGAALTDGSRTASWLAFVGEVGVLGTGLAAALGGAMSMIQMVVQARTAPDMAPAAWAWLVTPLLILGITLAPVATLRHPAWQRLDLVTGRRWTTPGKVLAALTLGSWLSWPVDFAVRAVPGWTDAMWPALGALLVMAAVVFLLTYRPGAAPYGADQQ
jgi:hypothetical protein